MIDATSASEDRLITLIADAARGPKKDGLFALWLMVRAALGLLGPTPIGARNHRRRLQGLGSRLSTLSLPTPLRRAFTAALAQLEPATAEAAALVLSQLVAPARDVLGGDAGDAVALAARAARENRAA